MAARFVFLLVLALSLTGCRRDSEPLTLFCGAGIRVAADELITAYDHQAAVKIIPTYAGSGHLLGQISSLKKGDLFMPGEDFYVDQAIQKGLADPASKRTVCYFIPVILVQKGNPKNITGLADLTRDGLRVGLGDERACAVGKRAVDLFAKNGIDPDAIAKTTVYKSGTVDELGVAIRLNQVDAVIVWDVTARHFEKEGTAVTIPPEQNMPASVSIVVLKSAMNAQEANRFADFLTQDKAKNILHGKFFRTTLNQP